MLHHIDDIVVTCAALSNLQPKLIQKKSNRDHFCFLFFFFFFLLFYHIIVRIFNGESFGVKPVETGMAFLCVFSWSRR